MLTPTVHHTAKHTSMRRKVRADEPQSRGNVQDGTGTLAVVADLSSRRKEMECTVEKESLGAARTLATFTVAIKVLIRAGVAPTRAGLTLTTERLQIQASNDTIS